MIRLSISFDNSTNVNDTKLYILCKEKKNL